MNDNKIEFELDDMLNYMKKNNILSSFQLTFNKKTDFKKKSTFVYKRIKT